MTTLNFDSFTEEQMEDYYDHIDSLWDHRKAQNSRKALASMFIFHVLLEFSDDMHHLSHADIIRYLKKYPYELELERKAVARHIGALFNEGLVLTDETGSWVSDFCPNQIFERAYAKRLPDCA